MLRCSQQKCIALSAHNIGKMLWRLCCPQVKGTPQMKFLKGAPFVENLFGSRTLGHLRQLAPNYLWIFEVDIKLSAFVFLCINIFY